MSASLTLNPVGLVKKKAGSVWIEIFDEYSEGLLGLEGFSHAVVLFWFNQNDLPEKRQTLQVHPRGDKSNPLTGVFATHSPLRPNLIGLTHCKILSIDRSRINIEDIDAFDGSPVIDIKCYIPGSNAKSDFRVPDWV
jgi:tRNA-Thr(GGU) m(6)t(6)A37 methyltransferase TsaA